MSALFRLKCDEAPEEVPSITIEKVLKVECNITVSTNYMQNGIMNVSYLFVDVVYMCLIGLAL